MAIENYPRRVQRAVKETLNIAAYRGRKGLSSPLYANALYLMANSVASAGLGFVFWMLAARLYEAEDIGLCSALVSAAMFLSFIGTLGLDYGLIRFIPTSKGRLGALINSSLTLSGLASVVLALIFLVGLRLWSPALLFVREHSLFLLSFIGFVVIVALSYQVDAVFIGRRRGGLVLTRGLIFSLGKLVAVIGLAMSSRAFGVFGIFTSWSLSLAVAFVLSLFVFLRRVCPGYRPAPALGPQIMKEMLPFSLANYVGEGFWRSSSWLLPLMVVHVLGAETTAHFYIVWSMAGLLSAISQATSLSLLAEGSHREDRVHEEFNRSLRLVAILLLPAMAFIFVAGNPLLLLFGRQYSDAGTHLLWVLIPAAVPTSFNFLCLGVARVQRRTKEITLVTGSVTLGTLALSYALLPRLGIVGAGVAWLASQTGVALVLVAVGLKSFLPAKAVVSRTA